MKKILFLLFVCTSLSLSACAGEDLSDPTPTSSEFVAGGDVAASDLAAPDDVASTEAAVTSGRNCGEEYDQCIQAMGDDDYGQCECNRQYKVCNHRAPGPQCWRNE